MHKQRILELLEELEAEAKALWPEGIHQVNKQGTDEWLAFYRKADKSWIGLTEPYWRYRLSQLVQENGDKAEWLYWHDSYVTNDDMGIHGDA